MIMFIHPYNNHITEIMWNVDELAWGNLMAHVNVINITFFKATNTHK